ncbi:uncharacterized protein LOC124372287 [Homalodisca vitripennis]|uniref:uncharacterized protein LOC124372287 n=1 Tax=Homalodisca vitripennis TaxID=197043 RepID=UPI001EEBA3B2|nr:uncharacterized protein LOC124372287 [Homalodisca vitripennis]
MKLNSKKLKQALERRKEKPQNASSNVVLQALQSCPPEKVEIKVEVSEYYVKTIASQPEEENTVFVEKQLLTYPSKKNDFRIMNLVPMKECDYPKEDVADNQLGETEEMHIVDFSELASSSFNPLKRLDGLTDSKVSSTTSKHITRPVFKVCQLCENQCFSTYKDLMDHYKSRHHVSSVPPPAKSVTTPPTNVTFKKRFRMLKKSKDTSSSSPDGQDVFPYYFIEEHS